MVEIVHVEPAKTACLLNSRGAGEFMLAPSVVCTARGLAAQGALAMQAVM